jgi:DNA-binding NarL/FixJ family response regulator
MTSINADGERQLDRICAAVEPPEGQPVHVLVLDDRQLMRESLSLSLRERAAGLRIEGADGLLESPERDPRPSVILLNLGGSSLAEPAVAARVSTCVGLEAPVIAISEREDMSEALAAVARHGLRGYFPASLNIDLLVAAIRLVLAGGIFVAPAVVNYCAAQLEIGTGARP